LEEQQNSRSRNSFGLTHQKHFKGSGFGAVPKEDIGAVGRLRRRHESLTTSQSSQ
jgi:hypothetical protein